MGRNVMKHVFTVIFILCIGMAAFLGWRLYQKEMEYRAGQESLQEIYSLMERAGTAAAEEAPGMTAEELKRRKLAQYAALQEENSDVVGWIQIEGTVIAYPVMYTPEDPDFYLYRNFKKEHSAYGSIYLDGACRLDGSTGNLLLYGHHMRNGDMFASLPKYDDPAYWKEHPEIEFSTLEEVGRYEVIAAFKQPAELVDEDFMTMLRAGNQKDYEALLTFMKRYRFYDTGIEAQWPDPLITLATCEYTQKDGRFFVVARKVEEE